jgi:hypothetical protein
LEVLEDRTLLSAFAFSPPVSYPTPPFGSSSVAIGDFTGNGKQDLAAVNPEQATVNLLLGNGDGTFQAAQNIALGPVFPTSIAVGDFDGRHYANGQPILDLAVTEEGNNNIGYVSVLMGNGDGTFQAPQNIALGAYARPTSIAVGDFDGRHYANGQPILDLAVVEQGKNSVGVLLGNGDGTFKTAQNYAVGDFPESVAVGDFNRDGKPDLVVTNPGSESISVLLGNGDGTFQTAQSYAVGPNPESVVVADFDGDGTPDLAVDNAYINSQTIRVLLGNGDGTFRPGQILSYEGIGRNFFSSTLATADFNGDGKADLVFAGGEGFVTLYLGNGDGTFENGQQIPTGPGANTLAVGDFNGDGRPDLAVTNQGVSVLVNELPTTTTVSGPTSSSYAQTVTYTASVSSGGASMTAGSVTFLDGNTPISPAIAVNANGQATFSIASLNVGSHTITASYSGVPDGVGTTGFVPSSAALNLTVSNPLPLSASAVNFSAIAGAPFTGTIATFTNPDPFHGAADYTALITWGDGGTSTGTVTGTGTLTVSCPHTYADPGTYAVSVQISHKLGNTTTATVYPAATVTRLGQSVKHDLTGDIGFWHNSQGQALINSFNGGPNATALSSWLAAAFPNLYGASGNNLIGATNAQVAAYYEYLFALPSPTVEAQVLATALNVYATTQSLGGTAGQAYGFTVSAVGLGAYSYNVGADGAAFGVANNTTLNVYELLEAVNRMGVNGVLYNGDKTLRNEANDLFSALNQAGSIG